MEEKTLVSYYLLTNPGSRENNEDNVGMYQSGDEYCFVLADGLGGHGRGEVASKIAVEEIVRTFAEKGSADGECLAEAMRNAQKAIMTKQQEERSSFDMKTTCVALFAGEDEIRWAHIGDSRLYCFFWDRLETRTLDHSVPQMLVSAGEIKEKQIRHHPDRNRLLRVMGIEWDGDRFQMAEPREREKHLSFLLCSDGFWELIEEKKMISCLRKAQNPEQWVKAMEEIVKANGRGTDMDNYSAVAVWF